VSLKAKIVLILLVVVLFYAAVDYGVQRWVIAPSFVQLEREEARKDLRRCEEALQREIHLLHRFCHDWAAWDDTYAYVQNRNDEYRKSNLIPGSFIDNNLNLIYVVDLDRQVVWGKVRDLDTGDTIPVAEVPTSQTWPADHPLLQFTTTDKPLRECGLKGVFMTAHGPMLVSARPILTGENTGPVRGTLVMARFLSDDVVNTIAAQTRVDFRLWPATSPDIPPEDRDAIPTISPGAPYVLREHGTSALDVFAAFPDIQKQPALLMRARVPREITAMGGRAVFYAFASLLAAAVIVLVALYVAIGRVIVNPLQRLTTHAVAVGESDDLTARLSLRRSDEIGVLAREFDRMVEGLGEARKAMVDTARRVGMAEVATGVLHNVGNVLNSVSVTTASIRDRLKRSGMTELAKVAALVEEHADDLAAFVSNGQRGSKLPAVLGELSRHLSEGQDKLLALTDRLASRVDHMSEIVSLQQSYGRAVGVTEAVAVADLVQDAIRINAAALDRHNVAVEQELCDLPTVRLDRQKVLQILINLISNAKYAVSESAAEEKRIILRLSRCNGTSFRIDVCDNGVGIPKENLTRIFNYGFTTRDDGHGYGLHSAALAAGEMGGTLRAYSDGAGRGARLALELPFSE